MNKRLTILILSFFVGLVLLWALSRFSWSPATAYTAYAVLTVLFLGMLVSSQQYEEDVFSKFERVASSFFLSYIVFFCFLYVPLSRFFFETLITQNSFFADLLALVLFMIFFFLFGTAFLVVSSYARTGFLPNWGIFNNSTAFFFFRLLFVFAVGMTILLFFRHTRLFIN